MIRKIFGALAFAALFCSPVAAQVGGSNNPGVLTQGSIVPGNCVKFGANKFRIVDAGTPCAASSGVTSFNARTGAVVPTASDYSFAQISGTLTPATQLPASGASAGTFGSATQCVSLTVTAQGIVTAASAATCTPAFTSLSGSIAAGQIPAGLITYAKLQNETANTVLGSLGATPPGELAVPSCSTSGSALTWSTGIGFGCNSITPGVITAPQGRLTLVSGVPEMTADVIAAQTLYYAPDVGGSVPVLVSGVDAPRTFISSTADQVGLSLALSGSVSWGADTLHDVFAVVDSGTLKLATRLWDAGMLPTEPQITNATLITSGTGAQAWVRASAAFDGTNSKPDATSARNTPSNSGLTNCLGQDWGAGVTKVLSKVVVTAPSDDNLRGDAPASLQVRTEGSNDNANFFILDVRNINASGAFGQVYTLTVNQSNVVPYRYHRFCITGNGASAVNVSQIQFFNIVAAANGRRLVKFNGRLTNDAGMTARTSAGTTITTAVNEGTYLGTVHIDTGANGSITAHFSEGPSRTFGVWNAYNQRLITLRAVVYAVNTATAFPITTPTNIDWSAAQGTSTFSLQVVMGFASDPVMATFPRLFYLNASTGVAGYEAGIGIDSTTGFSGSQVSATLDATGQAVAFQQTANLTVLPFFGIHTLFGVEKAAYTLGTGTVSVSTEPRSTALTAWWRG